MVKQTKSAARIAVPTHRMAARLVGFCLAVSLASLLSCSSSKEIAAIQYQCDTLPPAPLLPPGDPAGCGKDDPNVADLEPSQLLTNPDVCQTLIATRFASDLSPPSEDDLDTVRIQTALDACPGRTVRLVADATHNAFNAAHLNIGHAGLTTPSPILWVDTGVTLYASRDPTLYRRTDNCGVLGVNDSKACTDFISVWGIRPGIIGDGVIDGQGGEPLVGHDYSWWQLSYALRATDGSIGNPTLIGLQSGVSGFVMYRITLHNSPKFHVKLTSVLTDAAATCCLEDGTGAAGCSRRGAGFTVWGVTVLTPSKWTNSQGLVLTPSFARNTDGIDPGSTSNAECGLMACNTISTGDDHIAIKGGHSVTDITIAHNHFGTGHGMSIGSETYGLGIERIFVDDLTIDADSRPVGAEAQGGDFNGIRVKSDESRGGLVENITYKDVCMRDMNNSILVSTAYNPLFAGTSFPDFGAMTFQNVHHVTCMGLREPVVTLNGFNAARPAGPLTLDNVVVDNVGPSSASGQFSTLVLGPGPVNFGNTMVSLSQNPNPNGGQGLAITDMRDPASAATPKKCVFPTLPAPQPPPGWTW